MVQARPRNEVNVIFHINRCGLCKRCISATAIFAVLLVTFILAQDDASKLHYTSAFHVIDNTFTKNLEVKEAKEEAKIPEQNAVEETSVTTDNEETSESNIVDQHKFMSIYSESIKNTLNLMSSSDHIYTSPRSIEDIISEISPEMDISKPSGISYEDFVYAIKNCEYDKYGYIYECVDVIWEECQKWHLNEFGITGIIAWESGWIDPIKYPVAIGYRKNVMSVTDENGDFKIYSNYADAIRDGIRLIAEKYVDENGKYATGGNLTTIGETYCPETPIWPFKVAECAEMATRALVKEED